MVVLAASICTRGGKAVLSRQFKEMQRSRIEALLASFPKLADSGTQHTTVEQDNVRYVYQPLDELYMVLITNRQSNILQDIGSLHLFARVVSSICKSLDEREILRNAYELLSAFDEIVTLGYRENLTLSQIKTFLEMESHEERIQEIISRNKELEASEERKRKAKQLEMQRKELARNQRGIPTRPANYLTYTPAVPTTNVSDSYDNYNTDKSKSKNAPSKIKGMQLGKKSKTTNIFEQVRSDLGPDADVDAPLTAPPSSSSHGNASAVVATRGATARPSISSDAKAVHVAVSEAITAKISREGTLDSLEVKGIMHLQITDTALTQLRLALSVGETHGANLTTHPKIDKTAFRSQNIIQLAGGGGASFPLNSPTPIMRWSLSAREGDVKPPLTFTVWVNPSGAGTGSFSVAVEYEFQADAGLAALRDVTISMPFAREAEPTVGSVDAAYEVAGDCLDWAIGSVDDDSPSGSFEFEASADSDAVFFPMRVRFEAEQPLINVAVSSVALTTDGQEVDFSKEAKAVAKDYLIM